VTCRNTFWRKSKKLSPGSANTAARYWFLWVRCPACRTINPIDLRGLNRHPDAAVSSLIPDIVLPLMPAECTVCRAGAAIANKHPDEMREEHRRRVLGE
jgi:hypothetical protein